MNGIIDSVKIVFDRAVSKIKADCTKEINDLSLSDDQLQRFEDIFAACENPFEDLETRFKQEKFINEHLPYYVVF